LSAHKPLPPDASPPWPQRLLWFVGLWVAGVATTALVGLVIKFWLM
jgi:hypothetical protein